MLVDLTTAATEFEAGVIAATLRDNGVPAYVFALSGNTLAWQVAASAPIRIAVRRADLDAAHEILASTRRESVDIDWSEVERSIIRESEADAPYPRTGAAAESLVQSRSTGALASSTGWHSANNEVDSPESQSSATLSAEMEDHDPDQEDPRRLWRLGIAIFAVVVGVLFVLSALKGQPPMRP